jgi:hypothetical protein
LCISFRPFWSCRTAHDPFWELLGSRFTVPFLKSLVRDLSLDQKLRKLSPLGFALKGHRSSSMTNGLYPAQARGESCAVSRRNYASPLRKLRIDAKRKDTRESQYNRTRKCDSCTAPFYKRLRRPDTRPHWVFGLSATFAGLTSCQSVVGSRSERRWIGQPPGR